MQDIRGVVGGIDALQTGGQIVNLIATGGCIFFLKRLLNEFDALKGDQKRLSDGCPLRHSKTDAELASFKLEVAKTYASNSTVVRIHQRLDDMFKLLVELKAKGEAD